MPNVLVPAVCSLLAAAPRTQLGYKLNGPLTAPPTVEGDVEDARLSPDGSRLVYLARQDDVDVAELYSVPRDGSAAAVRLSGTLVQGGEIDDFAISPDSSWVVYQADQDQLSVHELFSVPIDGSASPTLLARASEAHAIFRHEIGPDSRNVAFLDTLDLRLRLVPIQGGSARALHSLRPGGYVLDFRFSPDGKRVLFTADADGRSGLNLYSAPVESARARGHARRRGARPVRLNAPLAPGTDIFTFRAGANGRVVYQVVGGTFDLFGVPADGGARPVRLNPVPVAGGHVTYGGYELAPGGERVVYRADQETDEMYELFSVPSDGSASAVKLSGAMAAGGNVAHPGFALDARGECVVYLADQEADGASEIYAVPIDASASALRLSSPPAAPATLVSFRIAPTGERVVYLATGDCGLAILSSVPLDRSSEPIGLAHRRAGPCGSDEEEIDYRITPDGRRVVYHADASIDGVLVHELFSVPIDGGTTARSHARSVRHAVPHRLNAALPPGGNVGDPSEPSERFCFAISPDGSEVVYRAGQESATVLELFGVPSDGSAPPRKLNPRLALGAPPGDVVDAEISPDGTRVVFRADREIDELFELRSVPVPGGDGAPPARIAGPLQASVSEYRIAAGSGRVVYLARRTRAVRLYSAPLDGGGGAIDLAGPMIAGGNVREFHVSPDGRRVAYLADQVTDGVDELFCVPSDGSATPVRLSMPLPPGGSVLACAAPDHAHAHFTSDGERVLYLADQERDQVFELWSVNVDGNAPPVRLSGPMVAGGDVVAFAGCFLIGATGRVAYLADQDVNEVHELYSAPLDGSSLAVKLNAPLVPGGDVSLGVDGVHLAPGGEHVVYRADQEVDERFELFGVPIDGSAGPVRLSGDMIAAGDVAPLAPGFSPGGEHVLFRADRERDGRFDLHVTPLDGSGPVTRLSTLPFHSRHVEEFAVDPTGGEVVYRADQVTDELFELFAVPLAGGVPRRLLAPGSEIEAFRIAPSGEEIVFAAALGGPGTNLWSVSLRGGPPVLLGGPMAGAGVRTDPPGIWISPTGRHVLYVADQEEAEVHELYASLLSQPRLRER